MCVAIYIRHRRRLDLTVPIFVIRPNIHLATNPYQPQHQSIHIIIDRGLFIVNYPHDKISEHISLSFTRLAPYFKQATEILDDQHQF